VSAFAGGFRLIRQEQGAKAGERRRGATKRRQTTRSDRRGEGARVTARTVSAARRLSHIDIAAIDRAARAVA
jgi:hypothetical protein